LRLKSANGGIAPPQLVWYVLDLEAIAARRHEGKDRILVAAINPCKAEKDVDEEQ